MERFVKYHGLGNDFLVVETPAGDVDPAFVRRACDRRRGAGADGVLALEDDDASDVRMTVFNADGSRPEMCGNGIRCAARHVAERGGSDEVTVATDAGKRRCVIERREDPEWIVTAEMGHAAWSGTVGEREAEGHRARFHGVDVGNPHAVAFRPAEDEDAAAFGRRMNDGDPDFPEGVNVELVAASEDRLDVAVYERGVGLTRACGTGACAAAVAAWETGRAVATSELTVGLPGGDLVIRRDDDETLWMRGPVASVYEGRWTSGSLQDVSG